MRAIVEQAWTRRGVHIGLSPKILGTQLEPDPEDEEAMRIHCPDGLSIDDIATITPASAVDMGLLKKYLNTNRP